MSIFKRIIEVTEAKINKLLNRLEDPNEILDLSYEKMLKELQDVRIQVADIVTEQKRLENKVKQCQQNAADREEEAKAALKLDKEDLAKQALALKHDELQKAKQFQQALQTISAQVTKLKDLEQHYKSRIDAFKNQKELTKASYKAAKAQVNVKESLTGIGDKLGNVGESIRRAEDKAEQMHARSDAMDSLIDDGMLNDQLGQSDSVKHQLSQASKEASVQDELERLKKDK